MDCKDTFKPTRRAGTSGAKRDSADVCLRREGKVIVNPESVTVFHGELR